MSRGRDSAVDDLCENVSVCECGIVLLVVTRHASCCAMHDKSTFFRCVKKIKVKARTANNCCFGARKVRYEFADRRPARTTGRFARRSSVMLLIWNCSCCIGFCAGMSVLPVSWQIYFFVHDA